MDTGRMAFAANATHQPESSRSAKPPKTFMRLPGQHGDSPRQKRSRTMAARSIPAQPVEAALKNGAVDLQAFVTAHEFEVHSLEQSMTISNAMSSTRTFQKVPRGLRRRTASHNPKRVPKRLRPRARMEMAEDHTPTVEARKRRPKSTRAKIRAEVARRLLILAKRKRRLILERRKYTGEAINNNGIMTGQVTGRLPRPKIRRNIPNVPQKPRAKFRKRQINKRWLPTHLWHAKRAQMTEPRSPLWHFAIPLTPKEKIRRPTHQAQGERGVLIWDMSYVSTIGLNGNFQKIRKILKKLGVIQESAWNRKGKKWRQGTRSWTGSLNRIEKEDSTREIGPGAIFWNPVLASSQEEELPRVQRQVFIRIHPSMFIETWNTLLRLIRQDSPGVYVEDLRFEIGSIQLSGPASTEALLSIIKPFDKHGSESQHAKLFKSLTGLSNPSSLPSNAILGFDGQDPRLVGMPLRPLHARRNQDDIELLETLAAWPAEEDLKPYSIFDRDARYSASLMPSQRSINRRRGGSSSGSCLAMKDVDPPIPLVLLSSPSGSNTQNQGLWTLLLPWKCVLPFWYGLVNCPLSCGGTPRFSGLHEAMQVSFERGLPWFPIDFLGTDAGVEWELRQRKERLYAWENQPKSKRPKLSNLDLRGGRQGEIANMFSLDFEQLFHTPKSCTGSPNSQISRSQHELNKVSATNTSRLSRTNSLQLLNHIPKSLFRTYLPPVLRSLPANAIITIRISLSGRGIPRPCARIYQLPSKSSLPSTTFVPASSPFARNLRAEWLSRISTKPFNHDAPPQRSASFRERKQVLAQTLLAPPINSVSAESNENHSLVPDENDLIGYVTTGSFCLSKGRGVAFGSVVMERVVEDVKANGEKEASVCVVRNLGEEVSWIGEWEVV